MPQIEEESIRLEPTGPMAEEVYKTRKNVTKKGSLYSLVAKLVFNVDLGNGEFGDSVIYSIIETSTGRTWITFSDYCEEEKAVIVLNALNKAF